MGSCGGAVLNNCSCSCPQHGKVLQPGGRTPQGMLKLQIPRYVQGEFGKQTTVEKNEGAAVFEWEKIQGGIQQHEMYILDTVDTA